MKKIEETQRNQSDTLLQWVKSQQQVFNNCKCEKTEVILPDPLPITATSEQKYDHAYQVASSFFYAMDYEQSARQFEAIANDQNSPYKDIALYLIFRSLFRDIVYKDASPKALIETYERLKPIIEQSTYKDDINGSYNHIKFKDTPIKFANEITDKLSNELTEPLLHELRYLALTQHHFLEGNEKLNNEFWEWRRLLKSKNSYKEALEHWKKAKGILWLIVILEKLPHDSKDVPEFIKAAEAIPETSPAYLTICYQLAKLHLLRNDKDSATKIIDKVLKLPLNLSTKNRFLDLKASFAKGFSEFLEDILQEPVDEDKDEYDQNHFSTFLSVPLSSKN